METIHQKKTTLYKTVIFLKLLISSLVSLLILRIAFIALTVMSTVQPEQPYTQESSPSELLLLALVVAPVLESLLIIGMLWITTHFTSRKLAMIITALIFGVMHLAPGVTWVVIVMTASLGYIFTYYYYKARSRGVSGYWLIVIIHFLSNALSIIPEIIQFFN
ncbi:MAG TPA: CPBP family intramembrane glutamic endopeptidase [Saprospiraceae bacterium]|nr:CPBP family intramembrane glutamic endopeptidase [Saprospiraceae bacterium]